MCISLCFTNILGNWLGSWINILHIILFSQLSNGYLSPGNYCWVKHLMIRYKLLRSNK